MPTSDGEILPAQSSGNKNSAKLPELTPCALMPRRHIFGAHKTGCAYFPERHPNSLQSLQHPSVRTAGAFVQGLRLQRLQSRPGPIGEGQCPGPVPKEEVLGPQGGKE